jgi:O-antigen/teichoic acid export membrane protein
MALSGGVVSASIWQISGKLLGRVFDFLTLIVLSRLLSPEDFGFTALAMSAVVIAEAVTELPLVTALVGVEKPKRSMYDTAFTLGAIRGTLLAVLLTLAAYAMAAFYEDDRLITLVVVLSLAPIFRGLVSPGMAVFIRRLDFRRQIGIEVAGKAFGFSASVVVAFVTGSYWAIAAATICSPLLMSGLSYWYAPYRPRLGLAHWQLFRSLVGWNSIGQIFAALNWQADRLLLGRLVSKGELGHFTMASNISDIVTQAIVVPMGMPLMAAYTLRNNQDKSALTDIYLRASGATFAVAAPIFLGLALMSHQAIWIALGKTWDSSADVLQWLSLIALIALPGWHLGSLAIPLGAVRMVTFRTIVVAVVSLPFLFAAGLYFGVTGVLATRAVSAAVVLLFSMSAVKRLIGCSFRAQLWALHRAVAALLVLAVVVLSLRPLIPEYHFLSLVLGSLAVSLSGAIAYLATLYVLWRLEGMPSGIEQLLWARAIRYIRQ